MLNYLLLSVFSTAGSASPSAADVEQLEKDKAIIRVLDGATDDYKSWVSKECAREDHDTANLAARAAAMSEERAIRTRNLAKEVDPADRAEYERAAAELFIEATDFWLKALACRPSRSMYLEHAELPLRDAEGLAGGDAALTMAIAERRKRIAISQTRAAPRPQDSPTCQPGDSRSAELVARHAMDRAIQARSRAEAVIPPSVTSPGGSATSEPNTESRSETARLLVEAAALWLRAWECRPAAYLYLDNASSLLADAEPLAADDKLGRQVKALHAQIAVRRAKRWTDQFSLRVDSGYASGRLARTKTRGVGPGREDGDRIHGGGYFSVAAMVRIPPRTGRATLLFGPYYTYWRALEDSDFPETRHAAVHEFGARAEVSVGFTPEMAKVFTLHPGLEFGLQYVNFVENDGPKFVKFEYTDIAGGTIGASLGACFIHSSICAMFRVHSVPQLWKDQVPVVSGGLGLDLFRVTHAVLERRSSPRRRR